MQPHRQGTYNRYPWSNVGLIDATAGAADGALAVGERKFQTVKDLDNVVWHYMSPNASAVKLRFSSGTNNNALVVDLWVGSAVNDPGKKASADCELMRIGTLAITTGQQTGVITTDLFADTITITNDKSPKGIGLSNPGTDLMAEVQFDMAGENILVIHGHTTVDADYKVWLREYAGV